MIRVGFILVFVYKSEDKPYRKRKCHCTSKSMKIQNKSKDYRSKKIIRERFIRVPRCYQCFIFLTCGHRRRLMDTMLSRRSFLLTWYPQPSAWTKFKHGGHGGHGSDLSLISYVSNGYWWLLRIWECWGTPYSLACTSDKDFLDKNRDKLPMPFTSLTVYQLPSAAPFREPALDGHNIRQLMVATTVTTS